MEITIHREELRARLKLAEAMAGGNSVGLAETLDVSLAIVRGALVRPEDLSDEDAVALDTALRASGHVPVVSIFPQAEEAEPVPPIHASDITPPVAGIDPRDIIEGVIRPGEIITHRGIRYNIAVEGRVVVGNEMDTAGLFVGRKTWPTHRHFQGATGFVIADEDDPDNPSAPVTVNAEPEPAKPASAARKMYCQLCGAELDRYDPELNRHARRKHSTGKCWIEWERTPIDIRRCVAKPFQGGPQVAFGPFPPGSKPAAEEPPSPPAEPEMAAAEPPAELSHVGYSEPDSLVEIHPQLQWIETARIDPDPENARETMDSETLQDLAADIAAHGVLQPILVRGLRNGRYRIIAGERRWRATCRSGLDAIPAIVHEVPDGTVPIMALSENLQRADLNPIEAARGMRRAMAANPGMTQQQLGGRIGRKQGAIAAALGLLRLPETVQRRFASGQLSPSHGEALACLVDWPVQCNLWAEAAARDGLTVAQLARRAQECADGERRAMAPPLLNLDPPAAPPDVASGDGDAPAPVAARGCMTCDAILRPSEYRRDPRYATGMSPFCPECEAKQASASPQEQPQPAVAAYPSERERIVAPAPRQALPAPDPHDRTPGVTARSFAEAAWSAVLVSQRTGDHDDAAIAIIAQHVEDYHRWANGERETPAPPPALAVRADVCLPCADVARLQRLNSCDTIGGGTLRGVWEHEGESYAIIGSGSGPGGEIAMAYRIVPAEEYPGASYTYHEWMRLRPIGSPGVSIYEHVRVACEGRDYVMCGPALDVRGGAK